MYTPLTPTEGPVPPRGPIQAILRLLLRLINTCFSAVSFLILGAALYMYFNPVQNTPPDDPFLNAIQDPGLVLISEDGDGTFSWFVLTVGGTGAYSLLTSMLGLSGCNYYGSNKGHLLAYIALMTLLIIAEAGSLLLVFAENDIRPRLPEDASGWWTVTQDFISNNQVAVKTWALGILGVQLLAIAIASWLHSIYQAAYEAWMDVVEEREQRTRQQLGRAVAQNYAGTSSGVWTRRLKNKYHVGRSDWDASDAQARQAALLAHEGGV